MDLEAGLHVRFQDAPRRNEFVRINSPVTNHTPMSPLFAPLPWRLLLRSVRCATDTQYDRIGRQYSPPALIGLCTPPRYLHLTARAPMTVW